MIVSVNTWIQICRLPLASPIEKRGEMSNRTESYANAEWPIAWHLGHCQAGFLRIYSERGRDTDGDWRGH